MKKNIFKFHSVTPHSLNAFNNSRIFCNHYSAFNDPFECWCMTVSGIPDPELEKERFSAVYRAWGFDTPDFTPSGIEELNNYCEQFDNEYAVSAGQYIESARISCFSEEISNLLMWSHYADGLRGFCIEFDPGEIVKSSQHAVIIKVKYKKTPQHFDTMVFSVTEDQVDFHETVIYDELKYREHFGGHKRENIKPYADWLKRSKSMLFELYAKQLAVKPIEWRYEKEARFIFHSGTGSRSGELFEYSSAAVKSIVFGEKMSVANKALLNNIVSEKYPGIPVGTAYRNRNDYKIRIIYD